MQKLARTGKIRKAIRSSGVVLMTATIHSLGLDHLSAVERVALADELWESVASNPDAKLLSEAHRRDLALRLAAYRDDPGTGSRWEEVKVRLIKSANA